MSRAIRSPIPWHKRRLVMDPTLLAVIVGSLGAVLVGTLYFLWARTDKKQ